jgi:Protein of unknown function (DUF992)
MKLWWLLRNRFATRLSLVPQRKQNSPDNSPKRRLQADVKCANVAPLRVSVGNRPHRHVIAAHLEGENIVSIKFAVHAAFALTLAGFAVSATTPARAAVEAGVLTCKSSQNGAFIVISSRAFGCSFAPTAGGPMQHYTGTVQRFGAQIGLTNDVTLVWAVFAATPRVGQGSLAGSYGGVSAGAAVGVGANANGLYGGLNNSFTLQPLSAEGEIGLNVVATVTGLQLQSAAPVRHKKRHK